MAEAEGAVSTDGRRLRWAEHRTQRRAAFVEAGVSAVDVHGPSASAEQIAESAGVSRTVLYRYFKDKDDLRQAIADQIVGQVITSVMPHLVLNAESTPRDVITSTASTIIGWFDQHPNFYAFLREQQSSLGAVETTLADRVAYLLRGLMMFFGLPSDQAEPGAYGLVGFVESSCAWWLARRNQPTTMSRDRFTESVCQGIWYMLDGFARASGISIGYDEPLPFAALTGGR
ncbi:MAG TPA: TetR/AcrR family transcriptional regulator [Jatrophihabitans sp.]|jgi:AcrR family transcriptional regulator